MRDKRVVSLRVRTSRGERLSLSEVVRENEKGREEPSFLNPTPATPAHTTRQCVLSCVLIVGPSNTPSARSAYLLASAYSIDDRNQRVHKPSARLHAALPLKVRYEVVR